MTYTFRWYFSEDDIIYPKFIKDKYKNNLFLIVKFTLEDWEKINLKWKFNWIPNWFIEVNASLEENIKYWDSYNLLGYKHYIPYEGEGVKLYLKKFFKLSDLQTQKVYDLFEWKDVLERILPEIDKLMNLKWLFRKKEKYEELKKICETHMEWSETRYFLYNYWINESQVKEVLAKFSWGSALDRIKENPYNLLKVKWVWFKTADRVFLEFWYPQNDERRIFASLYYVIQEFCELKHSTYVLERELLQEINNYLWLNWDYSITREQLEIYLNRRNIQSSEYDESLDSSIYADLKILDFSKWDYRERAVFIYLYYLWEVESAKLLTLALESTTKKYELTEEDLDNWDKPLNEEQKKALQNALNSKISLITWYGWTWKSTIIKKLIDKAKKEKLTYTLLAPTWKAVDVLIWITHDSSKCSTIHRKLALKNEWEVPWEVTQEDIIIVDESSMMALPLLYSLLQSIPDLLGNSRKKIIFVWDKNQLPPVWLWSPFVDMIMSLLFPEVRLFRIYRQAEDSLILENSKRVIEYLENPVKENLLTLDRVTSDWETYNIDWYNDKTIKDIVLSVIKSKWWSNEKDIILMSQYKWDSGIDILNNEMQTYLNWDNKYFFKWGYHKFFLWERVMHKNENWYREELELEWMPINIINNEENRKVFKKIIENYSPEDLGEWVEKLFLKEAAGLKLSKKVSFNWRTNNLEVDWSIVWEYRDWKLKYIDTTFSDKNWSIDKNVYNWNWGIIIACKTEEWWIWYNKEKNTKEWLSFSNLYVPSKSDEKEEYVLLVDFWDKIIPYTQDKLDFLTLYYCTSVHKAQWSQFPNVYALCLPSWRYMLDRLWLYTALSRAQEKLYYFSTSNFTLDVQKKNNLDRKRGIFASYLKYLNKINQEEK